MDSRHLDGDALCDYAEGLLAPEARREAEAHLLGCADCRHELEAVGGYFREMASLPVMKAPERFLTRVHARIDRASPWKRLLALLSSPRLLPVPLAVLVVAGVGAYLAIVSRDLAEPPQAGTVTYRKEERPATLPLEPLAQASQKPDMKSKAKSEEDGLKQASRPIASRAKAPSSPAAGGGPGVAMAPPAPKPAPAEPTESPLASSVTEASQEAGRALEGMDLAKADAAPLALSDGSGESNAFASAPSAPSASTAPSKALRKSVPASAHRGRSFAEDSYAEAPSEAIAAREAGGGGPWRAPGFRLEWNPGADPETFFEGMEELGIRVLRSDESRAYRYELLVPAGRLDSLEAYLLTKGKVTKAPKHLGAGRAGGPAVITLRILGDFSGR